jgi:TolA-binding protein
MKFFIEKLPSIQESTGAIAVLVLLCSSFLFSPGCAYFNKFYNARKLYREAKNTPIARDGSLGQNQIQKYDDVIEKCQDLITTYPDSRWVDDAVLLIGKSYYEQRNYDNAIQTLLALGEDLPDSELNEEAQEYIARSYLGKDKPEKALEVLTPFMEKYPNSRHEAVILYLLGTTSLRVGEEEQAMTHLETLALRHPKSEYRVQADLEMAEIFLEAEDYEKSLSIYEALVTSKLNEEDEIRCNLSLAETYVRLGMYDKALGVTYLMDQLVLPLEDKALEQLLKAEAYLGIDSLERAIDLYLTVGASYPRTKFSAEGNFHLGVIYQVKLDSLETARGYFEKVPREYAKSPYAEEAIKRSSNISQLIKLQNSMGEAGEEEKAFTQFSLAEVQLLQFNEFDQALTQYKEILEKFPESEIAPKAAYAIGYIYSTMIEDSVKAKEAYQYVLDRYPDTQQADFAHRILFGTEKPPTISADSTGEEINQKTKEESQPDEPQTLQQTDVGDSVSTEAVDQQIKIEDVEGGAKEQQQDDVGENRDKTEEQQQNKEGDEQDGTEGQQQEEEDDEQDGTGEPRE